MEAGLYLQVGISGNDQTTKKRKMHPDRAKLALCILAVFLSGLYPYFSLTAEATRMPQVKPLQQELWIQSFLQAVVFTVFIWAMATPAYRHSRRRKIE